MVSYKVSADGKWALLTGLTSEAGGFTKGRMYYHPCDDVYWGDSTQLDGRAGCLTTITLRGRASPVQVVVYEEKVQHDKPSELVVRELGSDEKSGDIFLQSEVIPFTDQATGDFPVSMTSAPSKGFVLMLTQLGYLFIFDIQTCKMIYSTSGPVAEGPFFPDASTYDEVAGVLTVISAAGKVARIEVDDEVLLQYILHVLRDHELALQIGGRLFLPGAHELYTDYFQHLLANDETEAAVKLAAESPHGLLRTPETVESLKQIATAPGSAPAVFSYLLHLMEVGDLDQNEFKELINLLQAEKYCIIEWVPTEDKSAEAVERLGELIEEVDYQFALPVYMRGKRHERVVRCLVEHGKYDEAVAYAVQTEFSPNYAKLLRNLASKSPAAALEFALRLVSIESGALIPVWLVVDILIELDMVKETVLFLREMVKGNKEDRDLQTKLFELLLKNEGHQAAEAILIDGSLTNYHRTVVAGLCEGTGLYDQALRHYADVEDIVRVMRKAPAMDSTLKVSFIGNLDEKLALECMDALLASDLVLNLPLVVEAATQCSERLGPGRIYDLFEKFGSVEGLVGYLANRFSGASQVSRSHSAPLAAFCGGTVSRLTPVALTFPYCRAPRCRRFSTWAAPATSSRRSRSCCTLASSLTP